MVTEKLSTALAVAAVAPRVDEWGLEAQVRFLKIQACVTMHHIFTQTCIYIYIYTHTYMY